MASTLLEPARIIAPPLVEIDDALPMLIRPSPEGDAVFCADPERAQRTTSPPLVVIGSLEPTITWVVALKRTSPVVVVVTEVTPPMFTAPAVAVTEIPLAPDAVMFAVVVTAVPVTAMLPFAESAAVIETAPVAGIEMVPLLVVVIELDTVTATPLIVTGPATEVVPPEIVTPDVFAVLPIRKLDGGPLKLKLVVLNAEVKFAPDDSSTTAPVVLMFRAAFDAITSPITVTLPVAVVALVAPRLCALVLN